MKTLTICGSMRFENQMRQIAWKLETKMGYNVLQCIYGGDGEMVTEEQKQRIVAAHYAKIDLSDGICVVDIDGYIGQSTQAEIAYALEHGKEIIYYSKLHRGEEKCPLKK